MGNNNSIINNIFDNVMNTDYSKLNKIIQNRYNNNFIKELKKLLVDFNINTCNKDGQNLLHIFTRSRSNIAVLKIILNHGCDINKKDNLGNTPIFYACETYYEFFIKHGADLNIKNNEGCTVLYEQSKYYFTESIKQLLNAQNCKDVYEQFEKHELLHKAILFQDIPKMKKIIAENKFLVNIIIKDPIMSPQKLRIEDILEHDGLSKNGHYLTPLYVACKNGLYDEFLCLLEHGANIHQNKLLLNMMHIISINENHIKIIKKLIELGINVNDVNDQGENLLHKCYTITNEKIVEIFMKAGVNIHAKTLLINFPQPTYNTYSKLASSNAEPLQYISVFNVSIKIYEKLFEYGADPNIQNNYGINAFMGICSNEFLGYYRQGEIDNTLEIIKLFVDNGADIGIVDNFGNNALDRICNNHFILYDMKVKIIKYLYDKFKFTIVKPKTNNFLYDILLK